MLDRPTPDPNLSRASVCPGQGGQAVSHGTVFPPGDRPFLLGLPGSVRHVVVSPPVSKEGYVGATAEGVSPSS